MKKSPIETLLGILVIVIAGAFMFFSARKIDAKPFKGYPLYATFLKTGGLESGSDIRINGIKVGTVTKLELTPEYTAKLELSVKEGVVLPEDTVAAIASDGLMGGKFLQLEPGKSAKKLTSGDTIAKTRSYKTLEDLVGEVIFTMTGK